MRELLEAAGFHIHGNRADCIHCEGHSRLTVSFNDEVAFCHRCGWKANTRQLGRSLGRPVPALTRDEIEERNLEKEFEAWRNERHLALAKEHHVLWRTAGAAARVLGSYPDCEAAWDALARWYHNEARLTAALDALIYHPLSPWLERPVAREELFGSWKDHRGHDAA